MDQSLPWRESMGAITFLDKIEVKAGQREVNYVPPREGMELLGPPGASWMCGVGWSPVLFNQDAQGLRVGKDSISIQAEVELTLGVLPTVIPGEDDPQMERSSNGVCGQGNRNSGTSGALPALRRGQESVRVSVPRGSTVYGR